MAAQLEDAPAADRGSAVDQYDVIVVGAGPAGLALSAHLGERGLKVLTCDPTLNKDWIPNYGVWLDEIEPLGLRDCLMTEWPVATVLMGGSSGDEKITLNRPYGRMDRKKFKQHMRDRCERAGVRLEAVPAKQAEHDATGTTLAVGEGDSATSVRCKLLVDCSGYGKAYVKFDEGKEPGALGKRDAALPVAVRAGQALAVPMRVCMCSGRDAGAPGRSDASAHVACVGV